jgi:hypothetical protein
MTKLSEHFSLEEMTNSQTAKRQGIDNTPSADVVAQLTNLCEDVLEPLRAKYGAITINSGYRSPALNKAVGGVANSQHVLGQAADTELMGTDNLEWAYMIKDASIVYDQLILEFYDPNIGGNNGWVHVSYVKGGPNRGEDLTINRQGTVRGLPPRN